MSSLPTPVDTPTPAVEDDAPQDSEQQQLDAPSLIAAGVRALALKKYAEAAEHLSYAIEQVAEQHGESSAEAGDLFMLYGRALLHNAIAQSAVLGGGNATQSKEETEEAVQNAVAGPSTGTNAAANWKFSFGGDAEEEEGDDGEGEGEGDEEEEGGAAAADRDDELEASFEAFEMAKRAWSAITKADETNEGDKKAALLKLAEAHKMLGEVERESEKFPTAVQEYEQALKILTVELSPSNRSLSELHMLIALAYDFIPDSVDRAVSHAEQSKAVLLLKLKELEEVEESKRSETEKREIVDIKELMGDLDMKIEDLKVVPTEAPKTEAEKQLDQLLLAHKTANPGVVNNLNSLVKKKKPAAAPAPIPEKVEEEQSVKEGKRKAEEPVEKEEGEEKKVKVDAAAAEETA